MSTTQKKGPAEAATSPSHGSNPTPTGKNMNEKSDSTSKGAAATVTLSKAELSALTAKHLHHVADALYVGREALLGISNEPRFRNSDDSLNPAGDVVSKVAEFFDVLFDEVRKIATASDPVDPHMDEHRAWLLLKLNVWLTDDLADFSALAASLVARHHGVAFRSSNSGRAAA